MRTTHLAAVACLTLCIATTASASTPLPPPGITTTQILSAYRAYKDVPALDVAVPTVVEVPFSEPVFERNDAVLVNSASQYEPLWVRVTTAQTPTQIAFTTAPATPNPAHMADGDSRTFTEFPVTSGAGGVARITLTAAQTITTASLTALLDANVSLPTSVEIRAQVGGTDTVVVAKRTLESTTIRFPKTTARVWTIVFTYAQPLRISELHFTEESAGSTTHAVRFLAQPHSTYRIYFDPDRLASPVVGESAHLASARDVRVLPAGTSIANPEYKIADTDGDQVPDTRDNCVTLANTDQADLNNNGLGDVCDDFDQDGVINARDNCPDQPNVNQTDTDSDGKGDVCDGEESRLTEKYPWLPWAGLGFAAAVLIGLFALMAHSTFKASTTVPQADTEPPQS